MATEGRSGHRGRHRVGRRGLGLLRDGDPAETTTRPSEASTPPEPSTRATTTPAATPAPTTSTTSTTTTLPATATGPPYQGWITRLVGPEVPPGLVTAEAFGDCSWERQIAEDGTATEITHDISDRPLIEVLPTDHAVKSNGCGPWTLTP